MIPWILGDTKYSTQYRADSQGINISVYGSDEAGGLTR